MYEHRTSWIKETSVLFPIIIRIINEKGVTFKTEDINEFRRFIKCWFGKENGYGFSPQPEMFQHKTNPKVPDYTYDFAMDHLKKMGNMQKKGHRLTFHPGQYNQLAAINEKVLEQTIKDLEYHADVLDLMELDHNSVNICGVYDDKD